MKKTTREKQGKKKEKKTTHEKCLLKRIYEAGENVYVIFQPTHFSERIEKETGIDV